MLPRLGPWSLHYGIPGTPTGDRNFQAWLSVKAVRDIASGLFIFILLAGTTPHVLGWFMLAAAGIPVGDALIVLRSNGPKAAVYGIRRPTSRSPPAFRIRDRPGGRRGGRHVPRGSRRQAGCPRAWRAGGARWRAPSARRRGGR